MKVTRRVEDLRGETVGAWRERGKGRGGVGEEEGSNKVQSYGWCGNGGRFK